jgi:hypothetical protein
LLGGDAIIESVLGNGSRITAELPLDRPRQRPVAAP